MASYNRHAEGPRWNPYQCYNVDYAASCKIYQYPGLPKGTIGVGETLAISQVRPAYSERPGS